MILSVSLSLNFWTSWSIFKKVGMNFNDTGDHPNLILLQYRTTNNNNIADAWTFEVQATLVPRKWRLHKICI
jgi:hypothetical protein